MQRLKNSHFYWIILASSTLPGTRHGLVPVASDVSNCENHSWGNGKQSTKSTDRYNGVSCVLDVLKERTGPAASLISDRFFTFWFSRYQKFFILNPEIFFRKFSLRNVERFWLLKIVLWYISDGRRGVVRLPTRIVWDWTKNEKKKTLENYWNCHNTKTTGR